MKIESVHPLRVPLWFVLASAVLATSAKGVEPEIALGYKPRSLTLGLGEPLLGELRLTAKKSGSVRTGINVRYCDVYVARVPDGTTAPPEVWGVPAARIEIDLWELPEGKTASLDYVDPRRVLLDAEEKNRATRCVTDAVIPGLLRQTPFGKGQDIPLELRNYLFPTPGRYAVRLAALENYSGAVIVSVTPPEGKDSDDWLALPKETYIAVAFDPERLPVPQRNTQDSKEVKRALAMLEEAFGYAKQRPDSKYAHWVFRGAVRYLWRAARSLGDEDQGHAALPEKLRAILEQSEKQIQPELTPNRLYCDEKARAALRTRVAEIVKGGRGVAIWGDARLKFNGNQMVPGWLTWEALDAPPMDAPVDPAVPNSLLMRNLLRGRQSIVTAGAVRLSLLRGRRYSFAFLPSPERHIPAATVVVQVPQEGEAFEFEIPVPATPQGHGVSP